MKPKILLLSLLFFSFNTQAQDVLLQGWYWDYPELQNGQRWIKVLEDRAGEIADAGFTYVWLPPLSKGASNTFSMGYDPRDLYDLGQYGRARWGSRGQLNALMNVLNARNVKAVADLVYNHRDGGIPEPNPAVEGWIENFNSNKVNAGDAPFPSDRFRCVLPIGGTTGRGAGDYYFKIKSASGHSNFYGKAYGIYMNTQRVNNTGGTLSEMEPNGGGDCGESFNNLPLGRFITANVDNGGCGVDEFKLTLTANDFNASGDFIYITLNNQNVGGLGDYSDHYIYGIWDGTNMQDIQGDLIYETFTDFTQMPSGRGGMNWESFKPNGNPTQLSGDQDGMWFFYDYDQDNPATRDSLYVFTKWMFDEVGIAGIRADAVKHFKPEFMGDLMDYLHDEGISPGLVVGEFFDSNANTLKWWIDQATNSMDPDTKADIDMRIFDFSLRQALKDACDAFGYDARNVFNSGLVDGAGVSPFQSVTFTDNHDTDHQGNAIVNDPLLANAYILTNNQVGLPTVFYKDYYEPRYLKPAIDGLIEVQQKYIFGANSRSYLNAFNSGYAANFIEGGASSSLIYQLSGAASGREVIVAINFAGSRLRVDQTINTANVAQGTEFTDIFSTSTFAKAQVNGSNQIYIDLPPRSFGVWVEGDLTNDLISLTTGLATEISEASAIQIHVEDEIEIQISSTKSQIASLQLLDLQGRIIQRKSYPLIAGINHFIISKQGISAGIYLAMIELEGKHFYQKVLLK
jgi:alpha-amylase